MKSNADLSRLVQSSQVGPHSGLSEVVEKHCKYSWQQPVHAGSRATFAEIRDWLTHEPRLILDSGCGTGHSVQALAEKYPESQVLGLDRSQARLARAPALPGNAKLARARCEDIWRLLAQAGISLHQHYLLYPNPWPKPGHLTRRWHAHPAFPDLLALGGKLELRCNWKIYADEFHAALQMCGRTPSPVVSFTPHRPLTLFERKYAHSGHSLYRLTVELS